MKIIIASLILLSTISSQQPPSCIPYGDNPTGFVLCKEPPTPHSYWHIGVKWSVRTQPAGVYLIIGKSPQNISFGQFGTLLVDPIDIMYPYYGEGEFWHTIWIPDIRELIGTRIFVQWLVSVEPALNPLPTFLTNAALTQIQ